MSIAGNLDSKNVYVPNLQDITESAFRTYGEACAFFEISELYLKTVNGKLHTLSEKAIYDRCNAIASDLAKTCEMFLKAIYIYEHNVAGTQINDLWNKLKSSEFKTDSNGNPIYLLTRSDGTKVYTYVQVDSQGNKIVDAKGRTIYVDADGNTYPEGQHGSKIKMNGHQLDRLIDLLSPQSKLLLETRMMTIPMDNTDDERSVSIIDVLRNNGVINDAKVISNDQYYSWIDQHKKTFEEARYSGQETHSINLEFLFHLTTQIKAVAQFIISPRKNQQFDLSSIDMNSVSDEIKKLATINRNLITEELIKLLAKKQSAKTKLQYLLENDRLKLLADIDSHLLFEFIQIFKVSEINYILYFCLLMSHPERIMEEINNPDNRSSTMLSLIGALSLFYSKGFKSVDFVAYCIFVKNSYRVDIDSKFFKLLYSVLKSDDKDSKAMKPKGFIEQLNKQFAIISNDFAYVDYDDFMKKDIYNLK